MRDLFVAIEPFGQEEMLEHGLRSYFMQTAEPKYGGHRVSFLRPDGEGWVVDTTEEVRVPDLLVSFCPEHRIIKVKNPHNNKWMRFCPGIPREPFLSSFDFSLAMLGIR